MRPLYKKMLAGAAVFLLLAGVLLPELRIRKKEVVLEFGMFTGSNWDVANANSFIIIDEAI